jgi:peptidoglycan-associated lipoprotein
MSQSIGVPALALAVLLAGCGDLYVKRDEFEATVAELRGEDARMRAQTDALKGDLQARFSRYHAVVAKLHGRVHVDMNVNFDYKQTALRDEDLPALDDFARVIRERYPAAKITVEGFTDPVGPRDYNKRLGLARAQVVRQHLIARGLKPEQLRAVSYGEDANRRIAKGKGAENRRVALVVDYIPPSAEWARENGYESLRIASRNGPGE